MEYKVIEGGGITSPKGFTAGAVYVGVKSRKTQKPDVAVLYSELSLIHIPSPRD